MRLIVAANRAPFIIQRDKDGIKLEKSPGGLVSALDLIMRKTKGIWVCTCKENNFYDIDLPYEVIPIKLSSEENHHYYEGFGNRQIWPLFHYFPNKYAFHEKDWELYIKVNQKFADRISSFIKPDDVIWIHDYHLMLVPGMLRKAGISNKIGFFMHIPFPSYEIFRIMPRGRSILEGLMGSDLIGFHTETYQKHFLDCVKRKVNIADVDIINNQISFDNRMINILAHPISIDFDLIDKLAREKEVQEKSKQLKRMFGVDIIGLGVDRLDYTKGIFERLKGIEYFLDTHPEYQKRFVFIQIAVPSRVKVTDYQKIKRDVDETVGRINGKFARDGWSPISYIFNSLDLKELVAYYYCADFALITALRDGLNLVAKEYIASRVNNDGNLILSEFTGAAEELYTGNQINPFDIKSVADGILRSIKINNEDKRNIMIRLRNHIRENNIYKWVDNFLCQI